MPSIESCLWSRHKMLKNHGLQPLKTGEGIPAKPQMKQAVKDKTPDSDDAWTGCMVGKLRLFKEQHNNSVPWHHDGVCALNCADILVLP